MYNDWQLPPPQEEIPIDARGNRAAARTAEDANWAMDDNLPAVDLYDQFADGPG